MSELYIRDLKPSLQEEIKKSLLAKRPDLKEAIENEDDVTIGEIFNKPEDYYAA